MCLVGSSTTQTFFLDFTQRGPFSSGNFYCRNYPLCFSNKAPDSQFTCFLPPCSHWQSLRHPRLWKADIREVQEAGDRHHSAACVDSTARRLWSRSACARQELNEELKDWAQRKEKAWRWHHEHVCNLTAHPKMLYPDLIPIQHQVKMAMLIILLERLYFATTHTNAHTHKL